MKMDELALVLADYSFDWQFVSCFPTRSKEFRKTSYKKWALDILWEEFTVKAFPNESCPIDELIAIANNFSRKMTKYSYANKKSKEIFVCAQDVATDVLDILRSMKGE
nr:MAG TPA: restriction endonuclease [Caudoviricetes sp.]